MAVIRVRTFRGIRPSMSPDLLSPGEAQVATNARLTTGTLEPYYGLTNIMSMPGTFNTIYRFGQVVASDTQSWMTFATDTNVVRAPIDGDTEERTYITSGDFAYPAKTRAALVGASPGLPTVLRMGIPAPATFTATVSGTATDPTSTAETSVYVATYVTSWGEEGPAGTVSNSVSWRAGQTVDLTGLPGNPSGAYAVTHIRLYRSATGTASAQFQYLTQLAIGTSTYADTTPTASLGDVLVTSGWAAPPDSMIGLTSMANGMLAGFTGNTVCFCEPFAPYAWPVRYQQSTADAIIGMAAFDQSLVVGTAAGLYVFTGPDPSSITSERVQTSHSLASKQSMVSALGGVVFASNEALVFIGPGGLRELTDGVMTRREWSGYAPSTMRVVERDGRLHVYYNNGDPGVLIWDTNAGVVTQSASYGVPYVDKYRDSLFVLIGGTLYKWDTDVASPLTYTWTSGVFRLADECNMAAARVDAYAYPVTFNFYTDNGVLRHTQTVTSNYGFRLPAGYKTTRCYFTLSGTKAIRVVEIATSMKELTRDG